MMALRVTVVVATLLVVTACATNPAPTPLAATGAPPSGALPSSTAPSASVAPAIPSVTPAGAIGASGAVAILGNDGSLSLVDASGRAVSLATNAQGFHQFPAWSPDGTRIAAIHYGASGANAIRVFDAATALAGGPADPIAVFESAAVGPIYLSWLPDGRAISFLASEGERLVLRIAPADGSGPLDGSGPDAVVGAGNPFYFDWIAPDRLLAHVGAGPDALLGELGLDGEAAAPALPSPGDFRSADVTDDGTFVAYVRSGAGGASEVVLSARAGGAEHVLPVFGATALGFAPAGHTLATIGPVEASPTPPQVPLGPLRLLDGDTGDDRVALDGDVLAFWWSPDGATLAALRIQPVGGAAPSASPGPSPSAADTEARLLFVDAADGDVRSEFVVRPGQLFIDQLLSFFDQYARSHRLWSPDSASLLFPVVGDDGRERVAVLPAAGGAPMMIDGVAGFWSP